MQVFMFSKICLGVPIPTQMMILMANCSIKSLWECYVMFLWKCTNLSFWPNFLFLIARWIMSSHYFCRTFLAIERSLVDVKSGQMKFWVNNEKVSFNVCKSMKQPKDVQVFLVIDMVCYKMTNTINKNQVDLGGCIVELREWDDWIKGRDG